MNNSTNDPDLNLQSFNDHGIFTLEELNELSNVLKPHLSALHLNIRSLWQKINYNVYPPLKLADQYLEQSSSTN